MFGDFDEDEDPGFEPDAPDEQVCADCGKVFQGDEDMCGICGAAMCFACFEMGCGVCRRH